MEESRVEELQDQVNYKEILFAGNFDLFYFQKRGELVKNI